MLWHIAGGILGFALGLWSGQMFLAMLVYWKGADVAVRSFMAMVVFVVGGGGGAVVVRFVTASPGIDAGSYVLGLAGGLVAGRFVRLPQRRGGGT